MKINIFQLDTGRRSNDEGWVSLSRIPFVGFILRFGSAVCEGKVHLTTAEAAQLEALLGEIEARIEREVQSEPSASAAAQEMRAMTSGGWDEVGDVNAAIREMRGSDEASA